MGLVIQAPTDSAPLAGITAAPADAAAAGNDVFAALLQSLLGEVPANAAGAPVDGSPAHMDLPLPARGPKEADKAETPLGDALAAALAALQLLPQPHPAEVTSAASATGSAPVEAPASTGAHPLAAGLPAGLEPAPAGHAGDSAGDEAAPALPAPGADVVHEPAATSLQASSPAGAADLAAVEHASATLEAQAPRTKDFDRPPSADDPPPTEAGTSPAVTDQSSVVRFVGNAQHQSRDQRDTPGDGQPKSAEPTVQPHASTQGIAHAAPNSPVGQLRTDAVGSATDVPAAAPAAPEIPLPVRQVSRAVLEQAGRGDGEARIQLDPAELGAVTIRVKTDGDHVRVEIHAERAEAVNLLRDNSADLSSLLGSRGLNLSDVYVGLGGHGARNAQDGDQQQHGERPVNGQFAEILGADDASPIELHNRLRTAYNPDGAHSYRV